MKKARKKVKYSNTKQNETLESWPGDDEIFQGSLDEGVAEVAKLLLGADTMAKIPWRPVVPRSGSLVVSGSGVGKDLTLHGRNSFDGVMFTFEALEGSKDGCPCWGQTGVEEYSALRVAILTLTCSDELLL